MNILYGVCGEGLGHAVRSAVVAQHLESRGHNIRFVSFGTADKYLSARWPGRVIRAVGMRSVMSNNRVQPVATGLFNIAQQTIAPFAHAATFLRVSAAGKPDVVISDFDPWSARYARLAGVPLIAVDNIHFMNRCTHPREVVSPDRAAAALMYPAVSRMVPGARRYLVTTFAQAPVCKPATTLHHPILRSSVLGATPSDAGHVLVYFNEKSDHVAIGHALERIDAPFRIYGSKLTQEQTLGNLTYKPFSEERLIQDLASSHAVIAGAGFTLMTESIFLGKPMLAVPFAGQFEQILNANYLERVGYGERCRRLNVATVSGFLERAPRYKENLSRFQHDHNRELLASVEAAIGEN